MFTFFLVNKDQNIISKFPTPFHVSLETVQSKKLRGGCEQQITWHTIVCTEIPATTPISLHLGRGWIPLPLDHELFLHFSKCPTDSARNTTQLLGMVSRTLVSGVAILRVDHNPAPYRLFNLNEVILSSLALSLLTCKMGIIIAPLPVGGGGLMLVK